MLHAKASSLILPAAAAAGASAWTTFTALASSSSSTTAAVAPAATDPFAIANALATATSASSSAAAPQSTSTGSPLHASAIKLGVSADTFTANNLLIYYSKRGHLASALGVFDETPRRNLVTWKAMVSAAARPRAPDLALGIFSAMLSSEFCPNEFALASALSTCCHCQSVVVDGVKLGCSIHGLAVKASLDGNPYVGSSLMLVYAKHRRVAAVERVFAGIASGSRDTLCWNAMLEGYVTNGYMLGAMVE